MSQQISHLITNLIRTRLRLLLFFLILFLQAMTIAAIQKKLPVDAFLGDRHVSENSEPERYYRSERHYTYPNVELLNRDGNTTNLNQLLDSDQGVVLNFIYTGCTTLCPLMSANFAKIHSKVNLERKNLRLVSISIDPDHDTPQHLTDYWRRFGAGPQWQLLTGRREDVIAIQKAFQVYSGKKANHQSVIFLKGSPNGAWVRLDGYPSTAEIINEYKRLANQ